MNDLLRVYVLCVLVLCLKMFAISCYQGFFRIRTLAFTNQEDAAFFKRAALSVDLAPVNRAAKAWANDLENIPLFFVVGGLCVVLGTPDIATTLLFGGFTVARVVHTVTYLAQSQPWRTMAYGAGVACLFGLGGMLVSSVV
ncbi:glutathione metabolism protein [Pseudomonas fluorescens]|uniref:Microsomal glutathione S-transferase 1 n=1 Tax=Pseudomonas fluorescens TaxID=294 RepID=A0A1T2Y0S2_PSEFL|nr:MAPEG family protein [Pseudomonas fluorescens]OPA85711.1 glutathione metabolism protein [Pseudomonas fluorescens]